MFGVVSGGHFNPAVTLAAWVIKRIGSVDALIFMLAQLSGGVLGALLCKGLLLDEGRATNYGAATVSPILGSNFRGSIIEAIGTFCLVLVILAAVYSHKSFKDWAPLAIGTTLGFIVMVGGPLTGGSFNPARWFGPALVGNEWGGVWPYLRRPDCRLAACRGRLQVRARGRRRCRRPSRRSGCSPPAPKPSPGRPLSRDFSRFAASRRAGPGRRVRCVLAHVRRVTFSRNYTLSLSRTCQCYCKYCAFATHQAHIHSPRRSKSFLTRP